MSLGPHYFICPVGCAVGMKVSKPLYVLCVCVCLLWKRKKKGKSVCVCMIFSFFFFFFFLKKETISQCFFVQARMWCCICPIWWVGWFWWQILEMTFTQVCVCVCVCVCVWVCVCACVCVCVCVCRFGFFFRGFSFFFLRLPHSSYFFVHHSIVVVFAVQWPSAVWEWRPNHAVRRLYRIWTTSCITFFRSWRFVPWSNGPWCFKRLVSGCMCVVHSDLTLCTVVFFSFFKYTDIHTHTHTHTHHNTLLRDRICTAHANRHGWQHCAQLARGERLSLPSADHGALLQGAGRGVCVQIW